MKTEQKLILSPFTMAFSGEQKMLEKGYREYYYTQNIKQIRVALLIAALFVGLFGFQDALIVPALKTELWVIRYYILCPLVLFIFVLSLFPSFKHYMQLALCFLMFSIGFGLTHMFTIVGTVPETYSSSSGLILVFIFGYAIGRLRLLPASIVGFILVVNYIRVVVDLGFPSDFINNNIFYLVSGNCIGMFTCGYIEYQSRRDYYLVTRLEEEKEKVRESNESLERRVKERTLELRSLNKTLESQIWEIKQAESEKQKLELELSQSRKMEAIGRLTGGISHDFNNILTAVNGYAELALMRLGKKDSVRREIRNILDSGQRAARLIQQLMAFSRKQIARPEPLNLNHQIDEMMRMLKRLLQEDIEIKTHCEKDLWMINLDRSQFEQVVINLAINARDAMPEGGKFIMQTKNINIGENDIYPQINAGQYVSLMVSDTGEGVAEEIREKIFEPFFTTKERFKGTGLGLATVYGIIKQNKGHIYLDSEVDQGAMFRVYFPKIPEAEVLEYQQCKKDEESLRQGKEKILLVEDEQKVREAVSKMLANLGYTVFEAENGEKALDICKTNGDELDLLFTDVVMPGIKGPQLAELVKAHCPSIKVLFMSGYADDDIAKHGLLKDDINFIQKPLSTNLLSKAVRKILD